MPIDPFLEPLLASLTPFPDAVEDWNAFRRAELEGVDALTSQVAQPGPKVREKTTVTIPVDDGDITLNVFQPLSEGPHPVHLYFHGGGWIGGSIHTDIVDITGQERAAGADCVVVNVEYRKAPEHPFPTGLNDCYAALLWVSEHAAELGVQTDAITVGGGSAGANLAAALTVKVRQEGGPALAFQLLEVPALDLSLQSPSVQRNRSGYGLDLHTLQTILPLYLSTPHTQVTDPYVSPLLAPDLSGLPPAHIMTAEYDPLCDDGERYATRLNEAGVRATLTVGLGHIHGSSAYTKVMASARAWRDEVVNVLAEVNKDLIRR